MRHCLHGYSRTLLYNEVPLDFFVVTAQTVYSVKSCGFLFSSARGLTSASAPCQYQLFLTVSSQFVCLEGLIECRNQAEYLFQCVPNFLPRRSDRGAGFRLGTFSNVFPFFCLKGLTECRNQAEYFSVCSHFLFLLGRSDRVPEAG